MKSHLQHAERVVETATDPGAAARSRLAASWRRSLDHHGLDPGRREEVLRISAAELTERLERIEQIRRIATPKLDTLFQLVGSSGCGVVLTDADGVVLDLRVSDADQSIFDAWGLAIGSDWSEASEGTNGIGTCIAEGRRVIIHRDEHFHARNTGMSCMDAPIFGAEGELIGALDVSSARADQTEAFNQLIAAMVAQTARQIEVDTFRASFPEARIIFADSDESEAALLLAVALMAAAARAEKFTLTVSDADGEEVFEGDPARGRRLADAHCGRCHVTSPGRGARSIGSTPSFAALRALPDWAERFMAFYALNPHPAIMQVEGITPPFDPNRPPPIVPIEITAEEAEHIQAYAATVQAADLGAPVAAR